jgi:hypothetical protein
MTRGARLAIVAGIIILIAAGATYAAVFSPQSSPTPSLDNGNATNSEPGQIVEEPDENLSVGAK